MKTNVFLKQAALASLLVVQTMSCVWSSNLNPETEEGPFVSIPKDVQLLACNYLDTKDLVIASGVSKAFQTLCSEDVLWAGRVPGATIKKDAVTILTNPVVKYPAKITGEFSISCYDVITFLKTGKFIVGDTTYACSTSKFELPPKQQLLNFLKGSCAYFCGSKLSIQLRRDGNAILSHCDYTYRQTVSFEPQKLETNLCTFVEPEQVPIHHSMTAEDSAKWMITVLSTLDDNYKDTRFGCFWGCSYAFEYLKAMLPSILKFKSLPLETKEKISQFFIQKYIDFRKVNDSPYGDGSYANKYLLYLKSILKDKLEIDCVFPA